MKFDMNPHSVTMRLKKTSELRRLCMALGGERLKRRFFDKQMRTNVFSAPHRHLPPKK